VTVSSFETSLTYDVRALYYVNLARAIIRLHAHEIQCSSVSEQFSSLFLHLADSSLSVIPNFLVHIDQFTSELEVCLELTHNGGPLDLCVFDYAFFA
jgi:hypothetical protein